MKVIQELIAYFERRGRLSRKQIDQLLERGLLAVDAPDTMITLAREVGKTFYFRVKGDDIRPAPDDYPCMGSAVARMRGSKQGLPPHVWLLDMHRRSFAGEGGGFLGQSYDPFRILQDPSRRDFRVQALTPPLEQFL